jgi:hypothetical protein
MKIKLLSVLFLPVLFIASCSGNGGKPSDDSLSDKGMEPTGENYIEDLLTIKDEKELKSKFSADRVTYDTIWGPEGTYTMGTYLDKGSVNEVQVWWEDSLHRSGVASVVISALYANEKYIYGSSWSSKSGVKLGMTTVELEKVNGRMFNFSGFEWDYGGGVMSWNNGKLENAKVGVTLTAGDGKLTEDEMTLVIGDQEVKSDDPVVKKMQPRVIKVSVY